MAPLKEKIAEIKANIVAFFMLFSPTNISEMMAKAKTMTPMEILTTILSGMFWFLYGFGFYIIRIVAFFYKTLVSLMKGSEKEQVKKTDEETEVKKRPPIGKSKTISIEILCESFQNQGFTYSKLTFFNPVCLNTFY